MEFRTELVIKPTTNKIGLKDNVLTIGSCFADDMAARLSENKFNVLKNPFGTVYNPVSIHDLLMNVINQTGPRSDGFLNRNGFFYHHDFHSDWNDRSAEELNQKLDAQISRVHNFLMDSQLLIITYGTSWVYEHKKSKAIVANCHKVPQEEFEKFLIIQKKIVESFENFYKALKGINPTCRIILTISPVRHIKDTLELNSVSKSILRLTCHALVESFQDVEYFPAYEIMLDDLRDYRFYKPDMIHPSAQAVDYIWKKFQNAYFNSETKDFLKEWNKIRVALQHKPFHPEGNSHQKFLREILLRLGEIESVVDVRMEIEWVSGQLK